MSDATYAAAHEPVDRTTGAPRDYFELLKPRVMSLVVFTALAGMMAAPQTLHPVLAFASILAIAVGAGASGALNMWFDWDIDARMSRTRLRPIPDGRVTRQEALAFGLILSVFAVLTLGYAANWLAAALLAFTIFFYVVVYTMWLKRWTPQNIVIGGAAGALPPMVGWAAATGQVTLQSFLLFLVIFVWTPPHFWALALFKSDDYGAAGVPMMPNAKGPARTRLEILIYTLILAPVGMTPALLGGEGPVYLGVSAVGGLAMVYFAYAVWRDQAAANGNRAAKKLFAFSILYLFTLFATVLTSHLLQRVL